MKQLTGRVTAAIGGICTVDDDGVAVSCQVGSRLRRAAGGTAVVAGDLVVATLATPTEGVVDEVLPRRNVLGRIREMRPPQILVANVDQALIVFAAANPHLNLDRVDRVLVETLSEGLPSILCINKMDLAEPGLSEALVLYEALPIRVHRSSVETGEGLAGMRDLLLGRTTVLWGPSGAGKSSLLNALWPGLGRRVKAVSEGTGMGTHATVAAQMFQCEPGTWVVDAPGWRQFTPRTVSREALDAVFPDVAPHVDGCRFGNCRHNGEPGCTLQAAVDAGHVLPRRLHGYLDLVERI